MTSLSLSRLTAPSPSSLLALTTLGLSIAYLLRAYRLSSHPPSPNHIPAPLPPSDPQAPHPYPPTALPGRRLHPTPYGAIHIYEFGPPTGERVLLLPGIGTPCLALGDMALRLAGAGHRVCLFDLFGRGYSDAPRGVEYDERLYVSQVLLVLGSSEVGWMGDEGFHLVGYSLGGGLAVGFARWFPRVVRSLVVVAGGGLIRRDGHVGWRSRLLYSRGWVPEGVLEWLVGRRIMPDGKRKRGEGTVGSDASGGDGWESARLSRREGAMTVGDVMEWQIREHRGFVKAFMSSIRYAPIYDRREAFAALGELLEVRRRDKGVPGLRAGKVLFVLGKTDSVIVKEELVEDATTLLGVDGLEVVEIEAGHEVAFTHGDEVADAAMRFWRGEGAMEGSSWVEADTI